MKKIYTAIAATILMGLSACGGDNAGSGNGTSDTLVQATSKSKKFAPRERESSMSASERQAAIAAKKASLTIDPAIAFNSRGIKLSILPPQPEGDITEEIAVQIAQKMLLITTQNGVGGVGNVPNLALGIKAVQTGREATGSAPQKMLLKYKLYYQVMNLVSGEVYAMHEQELTSAGRSFEEAASNMADGITNTTALQQMLQTAEVRILDYYAKNLQTVKNQVEDAAKRKNFDLALALLHSIPEQAKEAFQYATKKQPEVLELMKRTHAGEELAAMQAAIERSDVEEINPEVVAHMQMIPTDTPEYAKAEVLLNNYRGKIEAHHKAIAAKAAEDEAYQRRKEELEAKQAHEQELAQIEANKIVATYEAKASASHSRELLDASRGFWGNLGDRLIHGIDFIGDAIN